MLSDMVTVFGGSGFIGRHTVNALCRAGYRVRVAVRRPFLAGDLRLAGEPGHVQLVQANLRNRASVEAALQGASAAVNLAGVLVESGKQTFTATHCVGALNLAQAAREAGIERLVHISAMGADSGSASAYLRSKARGESLVCDQLPASVILRPSVVFGPGDDFFNRFAQIACLSPVLPLVGGGRTRFQPVHVQDVAACIVEALQGSGVQGRVYELGGPGVYDFRELLEFILHHIDRRRLLLPVPFTVAEMMGQALWFLFRFYPFGLPPLTGDQVRMLKTDNIVGLSEVVAGRIEDLGRDSPLAIEASVPLYLWRYRPGGQYHDSVPAFQRSCAREE